MNDVRNADTLAMVRELARRMKLDDKTATRFEYEIMNQCGYEVASVETTYTRPRSTRESSDFLDSLGLTEE